LGITNEKNITSKMFFSTKMHTILGIFFANLTFLLFANKHFWGRVALLGKKYLGKKVTCQLL